MALAATPNIYQPYSRRVAALSKSDWGTKRICHNCGTRYYDLNKDPVVCPKCSVEFDPEAFLKSRRTRSAMVEELQAKPKTAKVKKAAEKEEEVDEEEVEVEAKAEAEVEDEIEEEAEDEVEEIDEVVEKVEVADAVGGDDAVEVDPNLDDEDGLEEDVDDVDDDTIDDDLDDDLDDVDIVKDKGAEDT